MSLVIFDSYHHIMCSSVGKSQYGDKSYNFPRDVTAKWYGLQELSTYETFRYSSFVKFSDFSGKSANGGPGPTHGNHGIRRVHYG